MKIWTLFIALTLIISFGISLHAQVGLEVLKGTAHNSTHTSGYAWIGNSNNTYLSFDDNEIQARNGSTGSILHLNYFGGNISLANNSFNPNGRVGIGTITPQAKLHIADNGGLLNLEGTDHCYIQFYPDGFPAGRRGWIGYGTSDASDLTLRNVIGNITLDTDNDVIFDIGGDVGIGTAFPNAKLDVNGTSFLRGKVGTGIQNDDPAATLMVKNRMVIRKDGASLDTDYNFDVSTDRRFRIWRDGFNVNSIVIDGTALGVAKNPTHDISIKQDNTTNYASSGLQIEAGDDTNDWSIYINQNDNDLSFRYNNVLRAYILDGSGSFAITSDRTLKEAIEPIEDILEKVLLLKPSTYYYKSDEEKNNKSIGFISQEVEEIFPEMIAEHEGIKGLIYDDFAVLGIKAIQEQHEIIEDLQEENEDLKTRLAKIESLLFDKGKKANNSSNENTTLLTEAQLLGNQPNPFSESTTLRYFIPKSVQRAELRITNANGETLKVISIDIRGEGQTLLEAHALSAGNYFYSLVLDGEVLETKQMVLIE